MNPQYKDLLIGKYQNFVQEENQKRKLTLRSEIFNILNELKQPDSDDFYIGGLTCYMSDDNKERHKGMALEKFLMAYQIDSTNFMACLYIAHCFHDRGELSDALKYYKLVNKENLKEFQIWRYVKLIEQIGFCNYKLGNRDLGRQQFQEVLQWYKELPMEDRPVPTEMLQCLPESDEIVIEIKKIETYLK